jgi:hypothetical protein
MDPTFPVPNVLCRCGFVLVSWEEVTRHWAQHQAERASLARYQDLLAKVRNA